MSDPVQPAAPVAPAPAAAPAAPAPPPPMPAALPPAPVVQAAPAPAAPPVPIVATNATELKAEIERLQREGEEAKRLNSQLSQAAQTAKTELHRTLVTAELTVLAAKTLSPSHVVALTRDAFEVSSDGKVTVRGRTDVTPAQYLEAWLAGEGKHFLPPSVPTGAGASAFPGSAPQAAPMDLHTADGATRFVHGLLAPPAAPVNPARPGSSN